jgi:hypothetical protein
VTGSSATTPSKVAFEGLYIPLLLELRPPARRVEQC